MTRKFLSVIAGLALAAMALAGGARAQQATPVHYSGGMYVASAYNQFRATVIGGVYASGTVTIEVTPAVVTLPDGYSFSPWSTSNPVIFGVGTPDQETLTPSAVSTTSGGQCPGPGACELLTVTSSNAHGQGDIVMSGSLGLDEADLDAANNGGGDVFWQCDTGIVTLATGTITNTTGCTIPKTFVTLGSSAYVTTTITAAATYNVGIASHTATFIYACTNLTAGTNCSQFVPSPTSVAGGTGTTPLLITTSANPGAGALHVRVWGYVPVQSNN